ncbi:hypothetical protein IWQ62_000698 [Dispira parvispora]|uniref:DUF676 domain-containing protein n=1 Tax=Dispira parvispora TaxID=1520584 RepID=A0A9W8E5R7_9FUNG|nr:hypothetical protein IWQ62_000698 [Dispira parvispora]
MPLLNSATGTLGIGDVHRYVLRVDVSQLAADYVPLSIVVCNTSPFYRNLAVTQGPFALSATVEKRRGCGFATPYSSLSVTSLPTSTSTAGTGPGYSRDREQLAESLGLPSLLPSTHHSAAEHEVLDGHSTTLSPDQHLGKRRRRRSSHSSQADIFTQSESEYTTGTSMFILCGQDWRSKFHLYKARETEAVFDLEIISEINHLDHRVSYKVLVLAGKVSPTGKSAVYPLGTSSSNTQRSHESFFSQPHPATSSLTAKVGNIWSRVTNEQRTTDTSQWTIPQLRISSEVQSNPAVAAHPASLSNGDLQSSHTLSAGLCSSPVNKIRAGRRFSDPECVPVTLPITSTLSQGDACCQPTDQKLGDILTELHLTETSPQVFGDTCWTDHPTQWTDIGSLHLVVLSHGLMGSRLDELYIRESIQRAGIATESKKQHRHEGHSGISSPSTHDRDEPPSSNASAMDESNHQRRVVVLSSKVNHGRTHEGIDTNGQRLAEEILEAVQWQHNVEYYQRLAKQITRENSNYHLHAGWTDKVSLEQGTTTSTTTTTSIFDDQERGDTDKVHPKPSATWQDKVLRNRHRISLVGHSLGGLINLNALHHLNRLTSGLFFVVFEPVHFVTLATPFLGIGENFSMIGQACHWGAMGQTGKELAYLHKHHPKASLINSNDPLALASASSSELLEPFRPHLTQSGMSGLVEAQDSTEPKHSQPLLSRLARWSVWPKSGIASSSTEPDSSSTPEPLRDDILLRMGHYHKPYLQLLCRFAHRTAYANVDNDISVGFYTASLLYSNFDRDEFLKKVGQSTLKKLQRGSKLLWRRTVRSQRSLLHPVDEEQEGMSRWEDNLSALSLSSPSYSPELPAQPVSTEEGGSWSLWHDGYQYFRKFVSNPISAMSSAQDLQNLETTSPSRTPVSELATESLIHTLSSTPLENTPPTAVATTDTSADINPATRPTIPVIVHDETIADGHKDGITRLLTPSNSRYRRVQPPWITELAVGFHMQDLSWRKVHVYFPTDAHNFIVSRRRYHQHKGQAVVDHLVKNHPFT